MLRSVIQNAAVILSVMIIANCGNGMSALYDKPDQPLTLSMNPAGGVYSSDTSVSIISSVDGAEIRYTTNGSDPDGNSTLYSSPVPISGNGTSMILKAFASTQGKPITAIKTEAYTINYTQVSTPAMNPSGNTFNSDQNITITCGTGGAVIHYTTDGTLPDKNSAIYSGAVSVAGTGNTVTIKAIAVKPGMSDSTIRSERYIIQYDTVATPVMSPAGGTYSSDQSVTITCVTGGAVIHYTTDGITNPTAGSTVYSGPIPINGNGTNLTIKAIAIKPGMIDSAVKTEPYTISYSRVSTPSMNPAGGTYNTDQTVEITCGTPGADIFYTTDGVTDPTTGSARYTAPVQVAGHGTTVTIKAIAIRTGMADSSIAAETYNILYGKVLKPVMNPAGSTSSTFNSDKNVRISCGTQEAVIYYTTNGDDPTEHSAVYSDASPIQVTGPIATLTIKAIAVKSGMINSDIASEKYMIHYDTVAAPVISPGGGTSSNDITSITISCGTPGAAIYYTYTSGTTGTDPDTGSSLYPGSVPISVAGHGTIVTIKAIAAKSGMINSAVVTATYTISYDTVSTPTMNPAGSTSSTFNSDMSVEILCATPGADIYYTTDGITTPTTSSTKFTAPIPVTGPVKTTVIKAIAVKSGMLNSSVASEIYSIRYDKVGVLVMDPPAGTYTTDQSVTITCATSGAVIHYTTDGTDPDTNSPVYSSTAPIAVTGEGITVAIKAFAVKTGMLNSDPVTQSYVMTSLPPDPGNSGNLTFSEVKNNSVRLHWTKATDDLTAQADLQYLVYYSPAGNIDTVANIEANGTAVDLYEINIGQKQIPGLMENTIYYFNVIVMDQGNNKSSYGMASRVTLTTPLNITDGGTSATFTTSPAIAYPMGITTAGNYLYLTTWTGNTVVRVDKATGITTTFAGSGIAGSLDGQGIAAKLNQPSGICTDGINLYVGDTSGGAIRKVNISDGTVSTIITGIDQTYGITTDGTYVYATQYQAAVILKINIATGSKITLAGSGMAGSLDGTGTAAQFSSPWGICTDGVYLYVADCYGTGNRLRKIEISTAEVTTIAINVGNPRGITTDGVNVYICASGAGYVKKVSVNGGALSNMTAIASPNYITTDGTKLYVTDESNPKEITIIQ